MNTETLFFLSLRGPFLFFSIRLQTCSLLCSRGKYGELWRLCNHRPRRYYPCCLFLSLSLFLRSQSGTNVTIGVAMVSIGVFVVHTHQLVCGELTPRGHGESRQTYRKVMIRDVLRVSIVDYGSRRMLQYARDIDIPRGSGSRIPGVGLYSDCIIWRALSLTLHTPHVHILSHPLFPDKDLTRSFSPPPWC